MALSRRQFVALVDLKYTSFFVMADRGHMPTRDCEPYDALLYEVARDCGLDGPLAATIVRQAELTLEAAIRELDAHPDREAFFVIGWGKSKQTECWAAVAPLAKVIARAPGSPHFRWTIVDIAAAAKRIRGRAAKHAIPLERFSPGMRGRGRAGATAALRERMSA